MKEAVMFVVEVKHAYNGEMEHYHDTLFDAVKTYRALLADPYVNHCWLTNEDGESICTECGSVFAYDSATQDSVCSCGRSLD
jgi:hypothetical protein